MNLLSNARVATLAALTLVAFGSSAALAHHSAAMYDFTKNVWVAGVVKDVRVINPHMTLTLAVANGRGEPHDIQFEGHSVNNFYRAGWRPGLVKVGDRIKVRYNPRKDGHDGGFVNGFVAANGQEVAFRIPGAEGAGTPPGGTRAR
ncbi:MAG TPA: DUF6152 family protein [Steroidobacteraceae bacterium]|jgi:hypothetical protein|nr:DUF6152 family protein [Steroidobacteraceae bacterium]